MSGRVGEKTLPYACQVSVFPCRRRRENRHHTGRVMVMFCSGFLYSSFLQQLVSAWYVNRHNGIWVWLNVNAWGRKASEGGEREIDKKKSFRIRDVGCSELSGSLATRGGRWLVARRRTAKVMCSPRGSSHDMFVIYSITEVKVVGGPLCPSPEGESRIERVLFLQSQMSIGVSQSPPALPRLAKKKSPEEPRRRFNLQTHFCKVM